jgi:tRNA uridine 5-carboxymethylaminomethyl modification enzyme
MVLKMRQLEDLEIPEQFDFQRIISLGAEAREKLNKIRPRTLGQASRISGINPTDVQILMVYMGR